MAREIPKGFVKVAKCNDEGVPRRQSCAKRLRTCYIVKIVIGPHERFKGGVKEKKLEAPLPFFNAFRIGPSSWDVLVTHL